MTKLLDVDVEFGGVSIGEATARLGVKVERSRMPLDMADDYFAGKRLQGVVTLQSRIDEGQQRLPSMEDNLPPILTSVFDCKRFGVDAKAFSAGLTFALESIDVAELSRFAKRAGRLKCEVVGVLEEDAGDDDDDDEPAADEPRQQTIPEPNGKPKPKGRKKAEPETPAAPSIPEGKHHWCAECDHRWPLSDEPANGPTACPKCESTFDVELVGFGGDPNVNEQGVYVAGLEELQVPVPEETGYGVRLEVSQGADGKWRCGASIIEPGATREDPARTTHPGRPNRTDAIEGTIGRIIDQWGKKRAKDAKKATDCLREFLKAIPEPVEGGTIFDKAGV